VMRCWNCGELIADGGCPFCVVSRERDRLSAEVERLRDGIYAMCIGDPDQARMIDPVQWIKTRLVHVAEFNEALAQEKRKCEHLMSAVEAWQREAAGREADIDRLRGLCEEWVLFSADIVASDAAGQDWLDGLRLRTDVAAGRGE
jgi:hypothetical protein